MRTRNRYIIFLRIEKYDKSQIRWLFFALVSIMVIYRYNLL